MKSLLSVLLLVALAFTACARRKRSAPQADTTAESSMFSSFPETRRLNQKLIVTPENGLMGRVAMVNPDGHFVILNFPVGQVPAVDQRLNLYRRGLKVGEVKVSGPQQDDNVAADILAGDSEVGDEVREK